jgi:hypothetical protein
MNILGHYHFGITYDFVNFIRTFLSDNFQRNVMELTQTIKRNVIFRAKSNFCHFSLLTHVD